MADPFPSELEEDPGNPIFVEYAQKLRDEGRVEDAAIVCLRGVSSSPDEYRGRLLLANILYQLECLPFALRELNLLKAHFPESTSLTKLLDKLDPRGQGRNLSSSTPLSESVSRSEGDRMSSSSSEREKTLAETEFDFDDLEALSDDDDL